MIYKLKHVPTGLYYQPHKHRGSNLSKRGKVYQTATHGLSSALRQRKYYEERYNDITHNTFSVYCEKDSQVHKQTIDILKWEDCRYSYNQVVAETNLDDWEIEEIK
jgi:hypothetical protein